MKGGLQIRFQDAVLFFASPDMADVEASNQEVELVARHRAIGGEMAGVGQAHGGERELLLVTGDAVLVAGVAAYFASGFTIVSEGRFHGAVRESEGTAPLPFDEVWHLVKPTDGSREWAIAGIQQMAVAA